MLRWRHSTHSKWRMTNAIGFRAHACAVKRRENANLSDFHSLPGQQARAGAAIMEGDTQSDVHVAEDDLLLTAEEQPSTSGRRDIELLREAVINEKTAPELLFYEGDLISRVEQMIDYQEEQIELQQDNPTMEELCLMWTVELSRVRYYLRDYLRVRLGKVEKYVMSLLDDPALTARLSEKESSYAREFFVLFGTHLKNTAACHLPEAFNSLVRSAGASTAKDLVPTPNLDKHVFCRVLEDRGHVTVDEEGNMAEFNKGELFVIRYQPIQELLQEKAVQLT